MQWSGSQPFGVNEDFVLFVSILLYIEVLSLFHKEKKLDVKVLGTGSKLFVPSLTSSVGKSLLSDFHF